MDIGRLIEQLKAGDDTAGPVLVSILAPRLTGYAETIGRVLPEVDRELVVESAIETAIRRIDRYDPGRGSFPGWVRTFVRYAVADWRRRNATGAPAQLDDRMVPIAIDDDNYDEGTNPMSAALASLVLTMAEADQLIIRLFYVENLRHAQIAEQLGVSETACRKRLERALSRLRSCASDDPGLQLILEERNQ
jgi:RNA polymerase sigma-70 factor, ECF subfamily